MTKASSRKRDIRFYSEKNHSFFNAHSQDVRQYARILENDATVQSFQCEVSLELEKYPFIKRIGIRKKYFETEWSTDFRIVDKNNKILIREILPIYDLGKRAEIEKMEFSKRYWYAHGIYDWKIVVLNTEGNHVYRMWR